MSHGGRRPGAGRPRSLIAPTTITAQVERSLAERVVAASIARGPQWSVSRIVRDALERWLDEQARQEGKE